MSLSSFPIVTSKGASFTSLAPSSSSRAISGSGSSATPKKRKFDASTASEKEERYNKKLGNIAVTFIKRQKEIAPSAAPLDEWIKEATHLPPLLDLQRLEAFTHTSLHGVRKRDFEEAEGSTVKDYERLEWLGDGVIQIVVTRLIFTLYPRLTEGSMSRLRAALINNAVALSSLCRAYKLQDRLLGSKESTTSLRMNPSVQADLFESYVGGCDQEFGPEATQAWLKRVFEPLVVKIYNFEKEAKEVEKSGGAPEKPVEIVNDDEVILVEDENVESPIEVDEDTDYVSLIEQWKTSRGTGRDIKIRWEFDVETIGKQQTHVCICKVVSSSLSVIGDGKGANKKIAKHRAARKCYEVIEQSMLVPI